jgi:hypothetical protein
MILIDFDLILTECRRETGEMSNLFSSFVYVIKIRLDPTVTNTQFHYHPNMHLPKSN